MLESPDNNENISQPKILPKELLLNQDIKNIIFDDSGKNATLEQELSKIDKQFENDMETFNLMEQANMDVLKSLNFDNSISISMGNSQTQSISTGIASASVSALESNRKIEKVLDNKIIFNAVKQSNKVLSGETGQSNLNSDKVIQVEPTKSEMIKILLDSKIFFLNDKKLTKLSTLDIYTNLEELYLQRNFIKVIEGLNGKYLKNLQILNLNNNYIRKIENLKNLENLKILDLGDNMIDNFEIHSIPDNVVYLYLFDNLFYDKIDLLKFRSICIINLKQLYRLDCLTISDMEKLILIDEKNLSKRSRYILANEKLKHVRKHYEDIKRERRTLLREFEQTVIPEESENQSVESVEIKPSSSSVIDKDEFFLTDQNKKNNIIESLKERSSNRIKEFEVSSNDRMKDIKTRLDEIRKKFSDMPLMKEQRKEKIKLKINNAIKSEEKFKKAEEISKRIQDREEGRGPKKMRGLPDIPYLETDKINIDEHLSSVTLETEKDKNIYDIDDAHGEGQKYINNNNSLLTESDLNKSHVSHFSQASQVSYKNSLLTDQSDLSYIKKYNQNHSENANEKI